MRSIGELNWLNDYVGIPYVPGGRDMRGLDCYGLVKLIYHNEYGEELPDWNIHSLDLKGVDKAITDVVTSGEFIEKERPQDSDFVVCFRTKAAHHIGLFFGGGVIHAAEGIGVIYEPMSRFTKNFVKLKFGEWHP